MEKIEKFLWDHDIRYDVTYEASECIYIRFQLPESWQHMVTDIEIAYGGENDWETLYNVETIINSLTGCSQIATYELMTYDRLTNYIEKIFLDGITKEVIS